MAAYHFWWQTRMYSGTKYVPPQLQQVLQMLRTLWWSHQPSYGIKILKPWFVWPNKVCNFCTFSKPVDKYINNILMLYLSLPDQEYKWIIFQCSCLNHCNICRNHLQFNTWPSVTIQISHKYTWVSNLFMVKGHTPVNAGSFTDHMWKNDTKLYT
jgi:hypothetical protein